MNQVLSQSLNIGSANLCKVRVVKRGRNIPCIGLPYNNYSYTYNYAKYGAICNTSN